MNNKEEVKIFKKFLYNRYSSNNFFIDNIILIPWYFVAAIKN